MTHVPQVVLQQQHLILQIRYLLFHINTQHDASRRIQFKTRAGTGSSPSSSSPCSLSFDFSPTFIVCLGRYSSSYFEGPAITADSYFTSYHNGSPFSNLTTSFVSRGSMSAGSGSNVKKSSDGKTIYWYGNNAETSLNVSGYTYCFLAMG